jgi:hypothetical protein
MPFVVRYLLARNKRRAHLAHLDNGSIGLRPKKQADVLVSKEDADFFIRTAMLDPWFTRTDYTPLAREQFEVEYVFVPKAPSSAKTIWDHILEDD